MSEHNRSVTNELKTTIAKMVESIIRNLMPDCSLKVKEYNELLNNRNRLERVWLRKDCPHRDTPTFSNVPSLFTLGDLELFFIDCKYPTTYAFLYKVQKGKEVLDGNLMLSQQKVINHLRKVEIWIDAANVELNIMRHNLNEMPEFTEQQIAVCDLMYGFDWWYSYSDDGRVYQSGHANHYKTRLVVTAAVERTPSLKSIVEMVASENGFGINYFLNEEK